MKNEELVKELRNIFRAYKATDNGNCSHAKTISQAAEAIEELQHFVNYNKTINWIDVDEALPEDGTFVIATDGNGINVVSRFQGTWQIEAVVQDCTYAFTHWMQLPEPPKEET